MERMNSTLDKEIAIKIADELKKLPLGFKVQLTVAGTDYEWVYSLLNTNKLSENKTGP